MKPKSLMTDKTFEKWWAEDGRMYDPDTEDVPWFDIRSAAGGPRIMTTQEVKAALRVRLDEYAARTTTNNTIIAMARAYVEQECRWCADKGWFPSQERDGDCQYPPDDERYANAQFIANARTDLPLALAERERLSAEVERLQRENEQLRKGITL